MRGRTGSHVCRGQSRAGTASGEETDPNYGSPRRTATDPHRKVEPPHSACATANSLRAVVGGDASDRRGFKRLSGLCVTLPAGTCIKITDSHLEKFRLQTLERVSEHHEFGTTVMGRRLLRYRQDCRPLKPVHQAFKPDGKPVRPTGILADHSQHQCTTRSFSLRARCTDSLPCRFDVGARIRAGAEAWAP